MGRHDVERVTDHGAGGSCCTAADGEGDEGEGDEDEGDEITGVKEEGNVFFCP